jgi:hypothetical protein
MHLELSALFGRGHEVRKFLPKRAKSTYNPVRIHLHDVTTKEIVHFFSGPFDETSLCMLLRELTQIRNRYLPRNSLCCGIRLVIVEDPSAGKVLPPWFIPVLHASLPQVRL